MYCFEFGISLKGMDLTSPWYNFPLHQLPLFYSHMLPIGLVLDPVYGEFQRNSYTLKKQEKVLKER